MSGGRARSCPEEDSCRCDCHAPDGSVTWTAFGGDMNSAEGMTDVATLSLRGKPTREFLIGLVDSALEDQSK